MNGKAIIDSLPASKQRDFKRVTPVRFVLVDPDARAAGVAGSFNEWNPAAAPMMQNGDGHWIKELALPPGRYEYQFVVDGNWVPDWTAKESVLNPFGGRNSVLFVPEPEPEAKL